MAKSDSSISVMRVSETVIELQTRSNYAPHFVSRYYSGRKAPSLKMQMVSFFFFFLCGQRRTFEIAIENLH